MNTRPLTKDESAILQKLTDAGFDTVFIYLTKTGLAKSILDATAPVRNFLIETGIHDFYEQAQGPANKIIINSTLHGLRRSVKTKCSVYRPKTKKGDPRIWPYNLNNHANESDILALFVHDDSLHIINITKHGSALTNIYANTSLDKIIEKQKLQFDKPSHSLFCELKSIADRGLIPYYGSGSTAIGRSIEKALGIEMNSSKDPDYLGIELKSKRTQASSRASLFAQVPNWKLSHFKNAREILDTFGYLRDNNVKKLYCTVSSSRTNPQGLILDLNYEDGLLLELYKDKHICSDVCLWKLETLHNRLLKKHNETFWIDAQEITVKNKKSFKLIQATHTRKPSTTQFDRLLGSGEITLDHLLKLENDKFSDKGHLFKIKQSAKHELFLGEERIYDFT